MEGSDHHRPGHVFKLKVGQWCRQSWVMGGGKQLKIPPGGGFGKECKVSYIFFGGGGGGSGQPGNPSGYTLVGLHEICPKI